MADLNINITGTDSSGSAALLGVREAALGAEGGLRSFSQGLAGSIGLMPGLTFQSFALRNSIMALGAEAGVAGLALGAGLGLAKGLLDAANSAAEFNDMMIVARNNAQLSDSDFGVMLDTVKNLAATTGSAMPDIADGFRQVSNEGFNAADSQNILSAANELAVATGSKVADNAKEIASAIKDYGFQAADATRVENALYVAQTQGNLTQQELAAGAQRLVAVNGALGGSFPDVLAGISALTSMGIPAREAISGLQQDLQHLIAPTKEAQTMLQNLSAVTGVSLVNDFTQAGLASKGLFGVFNDLRDAGANTGHVMEVLFGHTKGGIPAIIESTSAWDSYKSRIQDVGQALDGEVTPALDAATRRQNDAKIAGEKLSNTVQILRNDLGDGLTPALVSVENSGAKAAGSLDSAAKAADNAQRAAGIAIPVLSGLANALFGVAAAFGAVNAAQAGGAGAPGTPIHPEKAPVIGGIPDFHIGENLGPIKQIGIQAEGPVSPAVEAELNAKLGAHAAVMQSMKTAAKLETTLNEEAAKAGIDGIAAVTKAESEAQAKGVSEATANMMKTKAFAEVQVSSLKSQLDAVLKSTGGEITGQVQQMQDALAAQEKSLGEAEAGLAKHQRGVGGGGGGGGIGGASAKLGISSNTNELKFLTDEAKIASQTLSDEFQPKLHTLDQALHEDQQQMASNREQQRQLTLQMREHAQQITAHFAPAIADARDHLAQLEATHKGASAEVKAARDQVTLLTDAYQRQKAFIEGEYAPQLDVLSSKQQTIQIRLDGTRAGIQNLRDGFNSATDQIKTSFDPLENQLLEKLDLEKEKLQKVREIVQSEHIPALQALGQVVGQDSTLIQKYSDLLNNIPRSIESLVKLDFTTGANAGSGSGGSSVNSSALSWDRLSASQKQAIINQHGSLAQQAFAVHGMDTDARARIGSTVGKVSQFASGTDYAMGGMSLLGEMGPELVDLPTGSSVYPLAGRVGARGGGLPPIIITGNTFVGTQVEQLRDLSLAVQTEARRIVTLNT